ncbi:major capsid protein [Streptosporangium saharense]|uniref:major capsid protein n=1 Tax=Streptosporangium saharense TaxID=1706840 RepID=UPI003694EEB7
MPVTLAQAQINARDDISHEVIDNLRRYSWVADQIVWDDTVTPGTNGASLVYGYTLLKTARAGAFRAINSEYTPTQAEREQKTVSLKPLGGAFEVDRVLDGLGPAQTAEVTFQMQQLLVGTMTKLQDAIINGDTAVETNGFDGLDKLLVGSTTEYIPDSAATDYTDWTVASVDTQAKANQRLDMIDEWLSSIVPSKTGSGDLGAPGSLPAGVKAILGNTKSIARMKALARWAAIYTSTKDDLGRQVEKYGDWVLIDMGDNALGTGPIIPIETRSIGTGPANVTGLTDLYAVTFGMDSFHGATMAGKQFVRSWLPDFSTAGAVKTGEIEVGPGAVVLRNTKSAGVLRNVKVS